MNGFNPNRLPHFDNPEGEKRRDLLEVLYEALPPGYAAQFNAIFELNIPEKEYQDRVRAFNELRAGEEVSETRMQTFDKVPVTIGERTVKMSRGTDGIFSIEELA